MDTLEALDVFAEHFDKLQADSKPISENSLANDERHVEMLKRITLRRLDGKEKFRIVVDYDPEFPLIAVDVFNLH